MSPHIEALHQDLLRRLPEAQVITDPLRLLAYGTDASFYRLVPEVVAIINTEDEFRAVLQAARAANKPVTVRAAGTSLSGQAITDGVLALIGEGFATCEIAGDAATVCVGPGIIGGEVNRRLAPFGRKIGPDPASINACKIGGIAANNASGMCCGTAQNSYRTLAQMRVVLADGSVVDTADAASVAEFRCTHAALLAALETLGRETRTNTELANRIRLKYRIKNTTGYSLNALVDYEDPIDILTHLMIGSEGTLGFIASITYRTVADNPAKASALVFFPDIAAACDAVIRLKPQPVAAVELLDRAALRSVQDKPGLPPLIRQLGDGATALLIEVRAENTTALEAKMQASLAALEGVATVQAPAFSNDPATCAMYWDVRKGTFPSVGAMRRAGTTVIIEDVAFPIASLAAATLDLQALLRQHGYDEAIIFGHALEGNLHFVFTQDFGNEAELLRYSGFMDDLCALVVGKYDGSLKAEHGTGRNMAPFVELEWGREATALMRSIKALFDPEKILNPGVILNDDPQTHLHNLKPLPAAEALVDRCIECGFCEPLCPSHGLTFSPRQRIVSIREIARREASGEPIDEFKAAYAYAGLDTCAGCGLCSTACPVDINTGDLTRLLRGREHGAIAHRAGAWTGAHFGTVATLSRIALRTGHAAAAVVGDKTLATLSGGAWKAGMPRAGRSATPRLVNGDPVVYFPTCGGRIFGPGESGQAQQGDVIMTLLTRAGYAPRLPARHDQLCCGQILASKGMPDEADATAARLEAALLNVSENGRYPIVLDASPCAQRMKKKLDGRAMVLDFHQFAHDALLPRLHLTRKTEPIALHINCSVRRHETDEKLKALVGACAEEVIEPAGVNCCGFGGDRGFAVPELNVHALRHIHAALPPGCCSGVSTNRTCEIGLTAETGRTYRSVAYLLEECSREGNAMRC